MKSFPRTSLCPTGTHNKATEERTLDDQNKAQEKYSRITGSSTSAVSGVYVRDCAITAWVNPPPWNVDPIAR